MNELKWRFGGVVVTAAALFSLSPMSANRRQSHCGRANTRKVAARPSRRSCSKRTTCSDRLHPVGAKSYGARYRSAVCLSSSPASDSHFIYLLATRSSVCGLRESFVRPCRPTVTMITLCSDIFSTHTSVLNMISIQLCVVHRRLDESKERLGKIAIRTADLNA